MVICFINVLQCFLTHFPVNMGYIAHVISLIEEGFAERLFITFDEFCMLFIKA